MRCTLHGSLKERSCHQAILTKCLVKDATTNRAWKSEGSWLPLAAPSFCTLITRWQHEKVVCVPDFASWYLNFYRCFD